MEIKDLKEENKIRDFYFWAFQITKNIIFNVEYYILGDNKAPYFSTSANEFNRPKTDYRQGGQAQADLLPRFTPARKFWEKWDKKHLQALTDSEYLELLKDIEELKNAYNYIEQKQISKYQSGFAFYEEKELSMRQIKKQK